MTTDEKRSVKGTLTLYEGVLNNDFVEILKPQYAYTGHNGASVKVVYYRYATAWSDREEARYFKSLEKALDWYKKAYTARAILQGACWLAESGEKPDIKEKIEKPFDEAWEALTKDEKAEALAEFDEMTIYCEV